MADPLHAVNDCLSSLPQYPNKISESLCERGDFRKYSPGQIVLGEADPGRLIRFLISGQASLMMKDGSDQEIVVDTLQPGDIFGEISFLTGSPSPSNTHVVADEPCTVLEVASSEFEGVLRDHPDFALTRVKNLARKIMRLDRSVYKSKLRRRALQSLISRQEHIFPDYVIGDYVRAHLATKAESLAASDGPVLIIGETGVGKEVLAHAIFRMSTQYKGVFLLLDLLRGGSEDSSRIFGWNSSNKASDQTEEQMKLFFGHEETSQDGEPIVTPGYIELTEDGTLLIRGIEQLPFEVQQNILEVIQTETFCRYGGTTPHRANLRLIATTNLERSEITAEKHPLLHGLLQRSLVIPPLRKRRKEIPSLVDHYVGYYCQELRKTIGKLPQETMNALVNYTWPGNDVELSSTLKRAILVSQGGMIQPQDIYFDLKRVEGQGKFNLLRMKALKQTLISPLFPAVFQSAVTPFFFILLILLFLGPADAKQNPAALFAWAVGWPILIVGAFTWARFWCSLCPIGTLSKLAKKVVSLERPFPAFLKNHSDIIIATAVICIIWFETATDIRQSPFNVGLLFLVMLASATTVAVIFERQSWCRYLCGLGGMISVLSKASFLELRADRNVCISQCGSNDCYLGNEAAEGCPFGIVVPKLHSNRFCKLCGLCVKSCRHGAITLNLRAPGREIWEMRHTNAGTAFLIIGMIGGLLTEMVSKMPVYTRLTESLPIPEMARFTLVFVAVLVLVNLMSALSTAISRRVFGDPFNDNYSRFGLALLPVALTGFMAFHMYYFINLGVQLPILLSEHFHFEIFRSMVITVPQYVTHAIQNILILGGLAWSVFIVYKIGRASEDSFWKSILGIAPHVAVTIALSALLLNAIQHFFYPA
jgi:transcriptional regulator with AAA-type ATPase domain/polyferredoxin